MDNFCISRDYFICHTEGCTNSSFHNEATVHPVVRISKQWTTHRHRIYYTVLYYIFLAHKIKKKDAILNCISCFLQLEHYPLESICKLYIYEKMNVKSHTHTGPCLFSKIQNASCALRFLTKKKERHGNGFCECCTSQKGYTYFKGNAHTNGIPCFYNHEAFGGVLYQEFGRN